MIIFRIIAFFVASLIALYSYVFIKRSLSFYKQDINSRNTKIIICCLSILIAILSLDVSSVKALIILHIFIISLFIDFIYFIVHKKIECNLIEKIYKCGIMPIFIAVIILGYGAMNMNCIIHTSYTVETLKNSNDYKIVLITDTHYATIQNTNLLKSKVKEINELKPDIVILGGDIVEEGTSKDKMEEVFEILGKLETKYGIYYVYGNHDKQPYSSKRTYTDQELDSAIKNNNIHILKDEIVEINDDLVIAGRDDAAWGNTSSRKTSEELLEGIDRNKYIIVVDHQPIEAKENNEQGVDLELSGHTHAGQIWPIGIISEWLGTLNYGEYQEGNCKVIVSSGFTGWGYPLRTEEHCEYVSINIK